MDANKTRDRSGTKCHFSRNKVLESVALFFLFVSRKKDIYVISTIYAIYLFLASSSYCEKAGVLEKIIGIWQAYDYTSYIESGRSDILFSSIAIFAHNSACFFL